MSYDKPIMLIQEKMDLQERKKGEQDSQVTKWIECLQAKQDFDLFDPTRIEDIDLKRTKEKRVVFMEPSRSEKHL